VSSAEGGEAAFAEVESKLGGPRILVNCAGVAIAMKTTAKDGAHPLDLYRKVIEVNLIGTFNMIRLMAVRAEKLDALDGGERARGGLAEAGASAGDDRDLTRWIHGTSLRLRCALPSGVERKVQRGRADKPRVRCWRLRAGRGLPPASSEP
jgi:hypothetical protein